MDHTNHQRLSETEWTQDNLEGAKILGTDDETLGTVSHVHGSGAGSTVIVDVGGFLGIGAKPVALNGQRLTFMRDQDGTVHATTTFTKDELKSLPEHHH
ncbi:PRC-barrel domain containing protein [Silicimonas algicola]|uniref:PRC-barrel domain protein n=1 Tax=Silicimonas algicola TaxID=1826607 RepID=A0A316G353_9RHOB|nr:PRC-barrel domain-containing protein [Silicimonas algicola]AZQ67099.1 PRC-barrel domain containing protein [Silicimonas algicola]PWK55374.1 PRC-barrel domain protein [Silicimonas algicola]